MVNLSVEKLGIWLKVNLDTDTFFENFSIKMSALVELDTSNSSSTEPIYVLPEVLAQQEEANQTRRWFHAHPEISMVEFVTAAKIAELLRAIGIEEVIENVGQTGVVGLIRGGKPGPCIALRADIDGLPILETATIDYKSQNANVMHACGHDGHITELLVATKILWAEREKLSGVIKLIFQPGEEGAGGARYMISDGVLEEGSTGPRVDEIYGIHIWSCKNSLFLILLILFYNSKFYFLILVFKLGVIGCEEGPIMAASDRFNIEVHGKGGHGAAPQQCVDAIVEAAAVVTNLQTIVSRSKVRSIIKVYFFMLI